jgi:DNA-binding MarR family transcriptional regulator
MDFFTTLGRYETRLWNALEVVLREDGQVSLATLQSLRVLADHEGEGRVHELSSELSVTIGAASKLVDRLRVVAESIVRLTARLTAGVSA